jgi:hypothetical protein
VSLNSNVIDWNCVKFKICLYSGMITKRMRKMFVVRKALVLIKTLSYITGNTRLYFCSFYLCINCRLFHVLCDPFDHFDKLQLGIVVQFINRWDSMPFETLLTHFFISYDCYDQLKGKSNVETYHIILISYHIT